MTDEQFENERFREQYEKASAALDAGDIPLARRYFLQAAKTMTALAKNSAPPLDKTRAERAKKLESIAESLALRINADGTAKDADVSRDGVRTAKFLNAAKPNEQITFDGLIGLDDAKAAIHALLIDPLKNPRAYARYGIKAGGAILLEGPAGTGKTTFAKAAANELGVRFAEVNANSLVDAYIGKTGKNIDALFDEARKMSADGMPVVLFIDEIDYLAQRRGGENKTAAEAVPALIKQMDGFSTDSDGIVIIAATNIKSTLDPAILSRFRNVINIPLPTESERKAMFEAKLKIIDGKDFASLDLDSAARLSDGFSGRDIAQVALDVKNALAARDAGIRSIDIPLSDLLSSLISKRKPST